MGRAVGAVAKGVGASAGVEGEPCGAVEEIERIGARIAGNGGDAGLFGFNAQGDGVGAGRQLQNLNAGNVGECDVSNSGSGREDQAIGISSTVDDVDTAQRRGGDGDAVSSSQAGEVGGGSDARGIKGVSTSGACRCHRARATDRVATHLVLANGERGTGNDGRSVTTELQGQTGTEITQIGIGGDRIGGDIEGCCATEA